jgi:error-prone DNA polymerase
MPTSDYVELRCRSAFSFLAGASLPEDLVARAADLGYDALALADRNGVYAAPRFFQAARQAGVRALVGAEVALAAGGTLRLLVESREGYRHLCRLLTAGALGRAKGEARVTWEQVEEHARGLHCLAGGADGPLAGAEAVASLARLRAIFGERLAVDVQRHGERGGERLARDGSPTSPRPITCPSSRPTTSATRRRRAAPSSTSSPASASARRSTGPAAGSSPTPSVT